MWVEDDYGDSDSSFNILMIKIGVAVDDLLFLFCNIANFLQNQC